MMIHTLVRGQKIDVTNNHPEIRGLLVDLTWDAPMNMDVDASAFLVGFNGKITKEEDFVFYGQPYSSCRSVQLNQNIANGKLRSEKNWAETRQKFGFCRRLLRR